MAQLGIDVTSAEEARYVPFAKNLIWKAKQIMKHFPSQVFSRHYTIDTANIFIRVTPWSEFIRIRAGSPTPLGWFAVDRNVPGDHYIWNNDGTATLVEIAGVDPGDFQETVSSNGKTAVFESDGWFYEGTGIGSPAIFMGDNELAYDGLSGARGFSRARVALATVSTDDEGVKSVSSSIYDFKTKQVFIDEVALIGSSVYGSGSVIEAYPTVSGVIKYRFDYDVVTDVIFHVDHSVTTHKDYADSWAASYSGGSGGSAYVVYTIQEKDVVVLHARDANTDAASEKFRVEFSRTRDYGAVVGVMSTDGSSVYRIGSEIVQSTNGSFTRNIARKTTNSEDLTLILTMTVLSTPSGEAWVEGLDQFQYAGSSLTSVDVRSKLYMYVDGVLTHTVTLGDFSKGMFSFGTIRTDVYFQPVFTKSGYPLRRGTEPTFFARVDLGDINYSPEPWYISGDHTEIIDTGTYKSGAAFRDLTLSLDGQFNFRVRLDSVTIDVYRHGTVLTAGVHVDKHELVATIVLSSADLIEPSTQDQYILYTRSTGPEVFTEHKLVFTSDIDQNETEQGTWEVISTPLTMPPEYYTTDDQEFFPWYAQRASGNLISPPSET